MSNPRAMQVVWCSLAAALTARAILPALFGLFDNDSANLLIAARSQAEGAGWSLTATLPTYLISVLFRLLGVKLWAARLVSAAAGVGAMLVLLQEGEDDGGLPAGLFAAALFAAAPIALFFSVSELPYALLTFLGAFGVWTLARAVTRDEPSLGAFAGLAWGGAFLCKTFAAVFVFPAVVFVLLNLRPAARVRRRWLAPLLAVGAWAIVVAATVAWRWPQFHWSVFNDYEVDWRFNLAVAIWSARWEDLVSLHGLAIPLFAPGLLLAAARREKTPLEQLNWLFLAAVFAVYLLNPVNHFPRVLLPALPVAAWFAGRELARAIEQGAGGVAAAWALLASALLALRLWRPSWHLDARPWLALVEFAAAGLTLTALAAAWPRRRAVWIEPAAALTVAAATAYGLVAGYGDLDRVERLYMAQVEAVRSAGATGGVLNSGDFIRFVAHGRDNYPNFLDLPRARLLQMFREGLPAMMRALRLNVAIENRRDTEGMLGMLAPLAAEAGGAARPTDPFPALAADPAASRTFDNGQFAVYRLAGAARYDNESWPEWSLVEPELDRTGTGVVHPTEARLTVAARPDALAPPALASERRVLFELTVRPEAAGPYDVRLAARDRGGALLWEKNLRRQLRYVCGAPGVPVAQFAVDRAREAEPNDDAVADNIAGVATIEARVTPVRGGPALWAFVRTPAWW